MSSTLSESSISELSSLYDGLSVLKSVGIAMLNQPRFEDLSHNLNKAGSYIEELVDCLTANLEAIVFEVKARRPSSSDEEDIATELEIRWLLDCGEDFDGIARFCSEKRYERDRRAKSPELVGCPKIVAASS